MAMTIEQFGQEIKKKYPQYSNIDDKTLGETTIKKYPQYQRVLTGSTTPRTSTPTPMTTPQPAPAQQSSVFGAGFDKFASAISAPFRALAGATTSPIVGSLAKPFGEVVASGANLLGQQAPKWTEANRLASPEVRAFQTKGLGPEAASMSQQLKSQGAKGAGFTDVLNVASLLPGGGMALKGGGALVKGAQALGQGTKVATGASKFLPALGQGLKKTLPSAAGWGGAYGAASAVDQGKSFRDVAKDTALGVGTGLALGSGLSLFGTGLGSIVNKATKTLNKDFRVKSIIDDNLKAISEIEGNNAVLRRAVADSKRKGFDVKTLLAQTDLLQDAVDNQGTIRTTQPGGAVEQMQSFLKNGENGTPGPESVISNLLKIEGKVVDLDDVERKMVKSINESNILGGDKLRAMKKVSDEIEGLRLEADAEGRIPLSVVHDAKSYKYANIDYLNPASKNADKAIARTLKDVVEDYTKSVDVRELNKELAAHYSLLSFLEKLDGRKVKGGRLGKYFARTIGAVAGSKLGPLGAMAGSELGGYLQGKMMSSTFSKGTGGKLGSSPAMLEALKRKQEIIPPSRQLGPGAINLPGVPDPSRLLSQKEAMGRIREGGFKGDLMPTPSSQQLPNTPPVDTGSVQGIAQSTEGLTMPLSKIQLDMAIEAKIQKFRQEAGMMANREGAGTTYRNVNDAAGNTDFVAKGFSLNKAKGSMRRQAEATKKEAFELLYENDPEFKRLVDLRDGV